MQPGPLLQRRTFPLRRLKEFRAAKLTGPTRPRRELGRCRACPGHARVAYPLCATDTLSITRRPHIALFVFFLRTTINFICFHFLNDISIPFRSQNEAVAAAITVIIVHRRSGWIAHPVSMNPTVPTIPKAPMFPRGPNCSRSLTIPTAQNSRKYPGLI